MPYKLIETDGLARFTPTDVADMDAARAELAARGFSIVCMEEDDECADFWNIAAVRSGSLTLFVVYGASS